MERGGMAKRIGVAGTRLSFHEAVRNLMAPIDAKAGRLIAEHDGAAPCYLNLGGQLIELPLQAFKDLDRVFRQSIETKEKAQARKTGPML